MCRNWCAARTAAGGGFAMNAPKAMSAAAELMPTSILML